MTTPNIAELRELARRLKSAKGPDREIDVAIARALRLAPLGYTESMCEGRWNAPEGSPQPGPCGWSAPHITASVDAALAWRERVLPGWDWRVLSTGIASVLHPTDDNGFYEADAPTPALALLRATVAAKIAELEEKVTPVTSATGESRHDR